MRKSMATTGFLCLRRIAFPVVVLHLCFCSRLVSDLIPSFKPDQNLTSNAPADTSPFSNPIIPGFHPDPSICLVGQNYYLVNSSFEYFPGIPVFQSRDLIHWKQIGNCLTRQTQALLENTGSSKGIAAATIRYHDNRFYVITTDAGKFRNFYVSAADPAGAWSDPIFVQSFGYDPSLFFDDDGNVYYTSQEGYGSQSHVIQYRIDIQTGRLLGDKKIIWQGSGGGLTEGPHLYKINNTYYLFAAEGGTGNGHREVVAGSYYPFGPFTSCPDNPVLSNRNTNDPVQCTGHADLFQDQAGNWWVVFLAVRQMDAGYSVLGRETFLSPVLWKQGWPVVGDRGMAHLSMNGPLPESYEWPVEPSRYNFDSGALGPEWCSIRNPVAGSISLTERPGWLRLHGNGSNLSDFASPAFAGRRQQHFTMQSTVHLAFNPINDGEEAGLAVRQNEGAHYEIALTRAHGKNSIIVRLQTGNKSSIIQGPDCTAPDFFLRITSSGQSYGFFFATDTASWLQIATAAARPLSPEYCGTVCYTGAVIGAYATGNGASCVTPADFDWFDYVPGTQ